MSDFSTSATVEVRIDERSLKTSRKTLEDGLGTVEVTPNVSGGAMPSNSGRSTSASMVSGSPGSAGGGKPWGDHIDLNERRNELLEDLKDSMDEGNFDRASRMGSMGGGIALGGIALGVGALSNLLSSFSWPSLPKLKKPGWLPPDIPSPDWLPIGVEEPAPVPVSDPDPMPVSDPDPMPVSDPDPMPVSDPDPMPVSDPDPMPVAETDPLEVENVEPLEVAEPDPIEVDFGMPDVSGEGLLGGLFAGAGIGAGALLGREFLKQGGQTALRAGSAGSGMFMTPEGLGITDHEKVNNRRQTWNKHTPDFMNMEMMKESEEHPGSVFSKEGRQAQAQGAREIAKMIGNAIDKHLGRSDSGDSSNSTDVRNNFSSNITVKSEGVTERDLEKAMEQAKKDALREFNRQISGRRR